MQSAFHIQSSILIQANISKSLIHLKFSVRASHPSFINNIQSLSITSFKFSIRNNIQSLSVQHLQKPIIFINNIQSLSSFLVSQAKIIFKILTSTHA